jgi:hypothetical protein
VHLVFMPMRANVHELERFVRIAADLHVDRMVLRPLNDSPSVNLDWERAGYRYQYQKELLPFDELVRVSGRTAELCRRYGVELADQMDFGGTMGEQFEQLYEEGRRSVRVPAASACPSGAEPVRAVSGSIQPAVEREPVALPASEPPPSLGRERQPACTEPWKSLYILRRGVFPCCYGGAPVASMDRYREAWNAPVVQAIRAELVQGRFHDYCLRSPACPIVRKSLEARTLPARQRVRLRARRWLAGLDRATHNRASSILHAMRWLGMRMTRAATDPHYTIHHLRRLLGMSTRGVGSSANDSPPSRH